MSDLRYTDIFVPGGFPSHTYNPRATLQLEEKIVEARNNLCKLVIVTGHTKSGKTVVVQNIFPREDAVWVDGGTVGTEDDFWNTIIDQLDLFQTTETENIDGTEAKFATTGSVEVSALVVKGNATIEGSLGSNKQTSSKNSRTISSKVIALEGLRSTKRSVVIDDFHYLPTELQGNLVRALKPLVFAGLPIVIIAIPHRRYDAVKVEREMTGRILTVEIPLWEVNELEFIPERGYTLLKTRLEKWTVDIIAEQSLGSPHLMQEFCRSICKVHKFSSQEEVIELSIIELEEVFIETAETIGRPIFEKLARGPRQRTDRIPRTLKNGKQVDIYGLVLLGLSHIEPDLITLEYEDLRAAIKEICVPENVPNIQEVGRVLRYMSAIAATDRSSTPVIDFDDDEKRLHITDPFFAFYLRWGQLSDALSYKLTS